MKNNKILFAFVFLHFFLTTTAQEFTSSNLPIVVIETDGGAAIPDEPKILGSMKIIWHQDGSRNYKYEHTYKTVLSYILLQVLCYDIEGTQYLQYISVLLLTI